MFLVCSRKTYHSDSLRAQTPQPTHKVCIVVRLLTRFRRFFSSGCLLRSLRRRRESGKACSERSEQFAQLRRHQRKQKGDKDAPCSVQAVYSAMLAHVI